jgi:hypothetical protein
MKKRRIYMPYEWDLLDGDTVLKGWCRNMGYGHNAAMGPPTKGKEIQMLEGNANFLREELVRSKKELRSRS